MNQVIVLRFGKGYVATLPTLNSLNTPCPIVEVHKVQGVEGEYLVVFGEVKFEEER